ncbi:hypothetical protein [Streptomyces sp. BK340]|uniref:hypothetical protein n=1 Tax=Streptomyces sp. BK340 TaxID=2572903 RepID=UPI0011A0B9DC|nr:hypothetical protein [Streptomyces sp. BK340]TVZ92915.1 hypothetical protein FB157_107217 [Streptomyces sp. BK340]
MTWTIDESRVRPFLTAAERHDVPALLWNALQPGRAFPGTDLKRQISSPCRSGCPRQAAA